MVWTQGKNFFFPFSINHLSIRLGHLTSSEGAYKEHISHDKSIIMHIGMLGGHTRHLAPRGHTKGVRKYGHEVESCLYKTRRRDVKDGQSGRFSPHLLANRTQNKGSLRVG